MADATSARPPESDQDDPYDERVEVGPFTFEEVLAGVLAVDPKNMPDDEEPDQG
jgi:hypothetical protein